MVLIKKYKRLLLEFIVNMLSFSLFILAQQIVALPIISKLYDASEFGKIVMLIAFIGIITSMFGFSIGNARLLDQKFYNCLYIKSFNISNIIVGILSFIIYYTVFSNNIIESFTFLIISVLANYRNFFQSEYRVKDNHNLLFKQNLLYFIGLLIGIVISYFYINWLIIFLLAELFSVLFSVYSFRESGFIKLFTDNSKLKSTNVVQLIINNGASYTLTQYDRFLIFPILGPTKVSYYYSASVSSKLGSLVMNPLSNYILGKISNKTDKINKNFKKLIILTSVIMVIIYFIVSVITTPILVKFLYPEYLANIKYLIIPICLGASIKAGANILKPFTIKYIGVKFYNKLFFLYGLLLIGMSIILCTYYNLMGIVIANIVSNIILFLVLLIYLKKIKILIT